MSFWRLNPGRDYTTCVPCFQQIPLPSCTCWVGGKAAAPKDCDIASPRQRGFWGLAVQEWALTAPAHGQTKPLEWSRAEQSQAEHHFCSSSAQAHAGKEQGSQPLVQSTLLATGEMWTTTYLSLPHQLTCVWACREVRELTHRPVTHSEILGEHS